MAMSYEAAAKLNGEVRIYIHTSTRINVHAIQAQLGYQYVFERPRRSPPDPWDYMFGDPRLIESEVDFFKERDRVVEIFARELPAGWEAEILYYPANRLGNPATNRAAEFYHWSSIEGILHPGIVLNPGN